MNFKNKIKTTLDKKPLLFPEYDEEIADINKSLVKLCADRFLSDRVLNGIWDDMCFSLAYIQLISTKSCEELINKIMLDLDYIRSEAIKSEEYETAKNCKSFFEIMLRINKIK